MKKCNIANCNVFTNDALWKCLACDFSFHAVCAGIQRRSESDILQYMVPMCKKCSAQMSDFRELCNAMQSQTDTLRKLHNNYLSQEESLADREAHLNKCHKAVIEEAKRAYGEMKKDFNLCFDIKTTELTERVECLKGDLTKKLHHNQMLCQDAEARNAKLIAEFEQLKITITKELSTHLQQRQSHLSSEFETALNLVANELGELREAAKPQCTVSNDSNEELVHIMKQEIKNTFDTMLAGHRISPTSCQPAPTPNLADELQSTRPQRSNENVSSGWRCFDGKKVWKPQQYWDDYDRRMDRRAEQERQAEKARRRRRRFRRDRRNTNNNSVRDSNYNNNNLIGTVNNNNNRILFNRSNYPPAHPSDRSMLAAAKQAFAGSTTTNHPPESRFIGFQYGETLNPYPSPAPPRQYTTTAPIPQQYNGYLQTPAIAPPPAANSSWFNAPITPPHGESRVSSAVRDHHVRGFYHN